ncbi:MAG: hypothetical protein ACOCUO_00995 [archaeon]
MSSTTSPTSPGDELDIEKSWTVPFTEGSWLHRHFEEILQENRDIIIVVDDYYGRRGTGKTIASMKLADGMDQTERGLTWDKVSLKPEEIRNAYADQPRRSGLVLDEGEVGASNRQAMTKTNQALREIMSMGRVEEKYVVVNTPIKGFLDKDILKLVDVWICMVRKGLGLVHFLEWEPYSEQLLTPTKQWIEFDDIPKGTDLRAVYNRLTKEKQDRIDGKDGQEFIPISEHKEALQNAKGQARQDTRNEILRGIFEHPEIQETDISQRMVGEAIGVSQSTISNILNDNI